MGMFDFLFDNEEVDPREKKALDYYKKHGKVPKTAKGWYLNYIPKSLGRIDRQNWMMQTDGNLQVK
jgi:hypothetical protein